MKRKWTIEEYKTATTIIDNRRIALTQTDPIIEKIAKELNRSKYSVTKKLGLEKYKEKWEDWVLEYTRKHTYEETAIRVGMSASGLEKLVSRVRKRKKIPPSKRILTDLEVLTLMRSSYLPSYHIAQFKLNYQGREQKLFDKKFGVGARWVHGMLVDDFFDLFEKTPKICFKSNIFYGRSKKPSILVPWVTINETSNFDEDIETLKNYQKCLYDASSAKEAYEKLKILTMRPIMAENVDMVELRRKTKEAYQCFMNIKKYLKNSYSLNHMKHRSLYRQEIKLVF